MKCMVCGGDLREEKWKDGSVMEVCECCQSAFPKGWVERLEKFEVRRKDGKANNSNRVGS